MKIKKYEGQTEKEAMLKVKEDLGREALIVSIKNIKPKGLYKIFKKPYYEVTAALDEVQTKEDASKKLNLRGPQLNESAFQKQQNLADDESFINLFRSLAGNAESKKSQATLEPAEEKVELVKTVSSNNFETNVLKLVYDQLLDNDVDEIYINQLMTGLGELSYQENAELDDVISIVYKRIIKHLSEVETIKLNPGKAKVVAFVGPTGVGKTTTIAKIASYFTLNVGKKVALITSDTYRIAAIEQLRTYANILNIPIRVVYTSDELKQAIEGFKSMDLILIDTAGRSHKNEEHQNELAKLMNEIPDKEVYLVLSLGTKYKDLLNITHVYNDISSYKLIFTKLDETSSYGNIVNIKLKTNAMLSYVTFGQNVPDDISEANIHEIAKKILGGCE